MSVVAIIPARGGSKGIPRKNVKFLAGEPLIAYTIESARGSSLIDRVVVSTDDAEIGAMVKRYGAEVVWRPAELSGDEASSEAALLHTLEALEEAEGYRPEVVVFLQCTSPLTLAEDIDGTIEVLEQEKAETALAVTRFHYFLWQKDAAGEAVGINHDKQERLLRQQRETQYLETGAIYVMRAEGFKEQKRRFFGRTAMYVMPEERCLEIDEPADFDAAEARMRERYRRRAQERLPERVSAVVFDFDGVFTDNSFLLSPDGTETVACNRSDGMGVSHLRAAGVPVLVLSTEENPIVKVRTDKLGVECIHGEKDKLAALKGWLGERGIDPSEVVYVGNDINDRGCLEAVGCGIVVCDAHPDTLPSARIVLSSPGGRGAIREVTDLILKNSKES